jgi:hypothetical protein
VTTELFPRCHGEPDARVPSSSSLSLSPFPGLVTRGDRGRCTNGGWGTDSRARGLGGWGRPHLSTRGHARGSTRQNRRTTWWRHCPYSLFNGRD